VSFSTRKVHVVTVLRSGPIRYRCRFANHLYKWEGREMREGGGGGHEDTGDTRKEWGGG